VSKEKKESAHHSRGVGKKEQKFKRRYLLRQVSEKRIDQKKSSMTSSCPGQNEKDVTQHPGYGLKKPPCWSGGEKRGAP